MLRIFIRHSSTGRNVNRRMPFPPSMGLQIVTSDRYIQAIRLHTKAARETVYCVDLI